MGRCALLNFKLPQSISDLELRAFFTHPRFMFYVGLAQCHGWAVTGHSSPAELGGSLPPALAGLADPCRHAGVNSRVGERQWAASGLWIQGSLQAAH